MDSCPHHNEGIRRRPVAGQVVLEVQMRQVWRFRGVKDSNVGNSVRMRFGRGPYLSGEAGMTTAEYAVGTVAAAGFAGLLLALLSSDEVRELLFNIVRAALEFGG